MTMHEIPTAEDVRRGKNAALIDRPVRPLDDIEADRRDRMDDAREAMARADARDRAQLERFVEAIGILWGREIRREERVLLGPVVRDLTVALGPMPAETTAPRRTSKAR